MKKLKSPHLLRAALAWALLTCACGAAGADPAMPHAFQKTDYSMTKPIEVPRPNVLLLLDVGAQMVFTPKGVLPMADDGTNPTARIVRLSESTYGSGARPINENSGVQFGRWGRDLDNSNNILGDPDCYYSSDPNNPYFLTFKDGKLPSGVKVGDRVSGYPHYNKNVQFPGLGTTFWPNQDVYDQLVPNDSRMYMMKLVLWRLTHPEDPDLLANINLAMATNYQEDTPQGLIADFYKYGSFGYAPNASYGPGKGFIYGTAPSWSSNATPDLSYGGPIRGDNYYESARAITGVMRDFYDATTSTAEWRHVHRAYLRVPFDRFYEEDENQPGNFSPTAIRDEFAEYIDGVETISGNNITNPELFADGQSPIATSLYARDYIGGKSDVSKMSNYDNTATAVRYAPSNKSWYSGSTRFQMNLKTSTNSEGLTAGQALGSAIDFFSPLSANQSGGLAFSDKTAGFFPVTGTCQSNWVVVFTAGNDEAKGSLNGKPLRTAPEAALELYKNSVGDAHPLRGREQDKNKKWKEKSFAMERGIRTLPVGFVDENATDPNSEKLRDSLNAMAANGQPMQDSYGNWVPNPDKTALFANDVPALLQALTDVLTMINADAKAGGGPVGAPLIQLDQEGGTTGVMYSTSYAPNLYDQWGSDFICSVLELDRTSSLFKTVTLWRAADLMKARGKSRRDLLYTLDAEPGDDDDDVILLKDPKAEDFAELAGIPEKVAHRYVNYFRDWLYNPTLVTNHTVISPLGDMQHSNFLPVARDGSSGDIYIQTNRGTLHALDAQTGQERWGFIPPNVFQGRLKSLKFSETHQWYDGTGNAEDSRQSMPLVLLDGRMDDVVIPSAKKHILVATTGYGGNGVYAMDITKRQKEPQFLWAVDNVRYATPSADGVRRWGKAAKGSNSDRRDFDYSDLGLSIQAVNLLNVSGDTRDVVGVLPGGLGYNLGGDSQGKLIYALDPQDGQILRRLDDSRLTKHPVAKSSLGMMLAPLTLVKQTNSDVVTEFFTGDSEGNVLSCDILDRKVADWRLKSLFRLETVDNDGHRANKPKGISIPFALLRLIRKTDNAITLIGATSDILGPGSGTDPDRRVRNEQQFVFCVRPDLMKGNETMTNLESRTLTEVLHESTAGTPLANDKVGWFYRMAKETSTHEAEMATTAPYFYSGMVFVATFAQEKGDDTFCSYTDKGKGKVYGLDPETGRAKMEALILDNVKVTGITGMQGHMILSVDEKATGAMDAAVAASPGVNKVSENLLDVPISEVDETSHDYGVPHADYWRDFDMEAMSGK